MNAQFFPDYFRYILFAHRAGLVTKKEARNWLAAADSTFADVIGKPPPSFVELRRKKAA